MRRPARTRRIVRAAVLPACLAAALVVAMATATSASAATRECFLLTQCTPVTGPWVVVPAAAPNPLPAGATVSCPSDDSVQLPVGSDYELSGGGLPPPAVTRFIQGPGLGLINGANAFFYAVNFAGTAGSFRPHVGCIPQPQQGAALTATPAPGPSGTLRTRELRLRPSRTTTARHRCRTGERLAQGLSGVLFDRRRPPTARELRDVTVSQLRVGREVRTTVTTGRTVGDRERVILQVHAVCAR